MKLVDVYYNLHKKCLSVRDVATRRVDQHVDHIALQNAKFHVSASGRARVLKERRKNVHAWVRGYVASESAECSTQVTYNPYKYASFVTKSDEKPVVCAEHVNIKGRCIFID
jgi:hypothetical protein